MLLLDELPNISGFAPDTDWDMVRRQFRAVRVRQDVYKTACDLAGRTSHKKLEGLSRFVCWPDRHVWLETEPDDEGRRLVFIFHAEEGNEEQTTRGDGFIVMDDPGKEMINIPVLYDLENYKLVLDHEIVKKEAYKGMFDIELIDPIVAYRQFGKILSLFKPIVFSLLALINSPKLIRVREANLDKINARRIKRGKYPFHPHHEITINIDKHIGKITRGLGDGPERAQHFVRAHPRFLVHPRYKNVEVVMVPPHYRGNPELGMRNTCYNVASDRSK